jgi:hypothetical protein
MVECVHRSREYTHTHARASSDLNSSGEHLATKLQIGERLFPYV